MLGFIIEFWVEWALGILATVFACCYRKVLKDMKRKELEQDALKVGMIAVLHDRLFQECTMYIRMGYIPIDESEKILDNLRIVYNAYHNLGGNGTGTDLYERATALPLK